jgi:large subunit ribosomal protein L7Ae
MPSKKTSSKKKVAQAEPAAPAQNPLFKPQPRNFRIGGDIQPRKDLSRFVKWPRCVRLQRQRKVLFQRLKVPPQVNQFTKSLDRKQAREAVALFQKYSPETKADKKARLRRAAEEEAKGDEADRPARPHTVHFGVNHVVSLIEKKKAKLVLIADDVNPLEIVVYIPALCRKMGVPYAIVRGKARLGSVVHQKNATCLALTNVNKEDKKSLDSLTERFMDQYNHNADALRRWGGGVMGLKTQARLEKRAAALQAELDKRQLY